MKTLAAIAVAVASLIFEVPFAPERADTMLRETSAADQPNAGKRRAREQREDKLRVMKRTDRDAIVWSNEKRPNGTIVLTLDPPLEKTGEGQVVEVELFSAFVDDDGSTELGCRARELALGTWWPSIEKAGVPVHLVHRQVDLGPGLDSRYHESRRKIGELVAGGAWYAANGDERGLEVVTATMERLRKDDTLREVTQADIEQILAGARIDPGPWRDETREKVEASRTHDNARWEHVASQALSWARHVKLGKGASPVLVLDGRYLVTMNTVWRQGGLRATQRLFQTVNSLVKKRLEAIGARKSKRTEKTNRRKP